MVPWTTPGPLPDETYTFGTNEGTAATTSDVFANVYFTSTYRPPIRLPSDEEQKAARQQMLAERERRQWKKRAKKHDFHQAKWSWNRPKFR